MEIYNYTLHIADAEVAARAGMHLLIRRAAAGMPLIAALVKSGSIVNVTLDGLQCMLDAYKVRLKKTTSKAMKIREIMRLLVVQEHTTEEERERVEDTLKNMELKRSKKKNNSTDCEPGDEEQEEAGYFNHLLVLSLFGRPAIINVYRV